MCIYIHEKHDICIFLKIGHWVLSADKFISHPSKRKVQFPNSAFPSLMLFWGSTFAITESPLFRYGFVNLIFLF